MEIKLVEKRYFLPIQKLFTCWDRNVIDILSFSFFFKFIHFVLRTTKYAPEKCLKLLLDTILLSFYFIQRILIFVSSFFFSLCFSLSTLVVISTCGPWSCLLLYRLDYVRITSCGEESIVLGLEYFFFFSSVRISHRTKEKKCTNEKLSSSGAFRLHHKYHYLVLYHLISPATSHNKR